MQVRILAACTDGGVGDLLAALPAINALHRHFGVPVDVLATPYAAPVLRGQDAVGTVMWDDGRETVLSLARRLAANRYSHAVVFWSTPRIARAVAAAGIPVRVGQARRLYSFRYTKRVTVRSETGDTTSHWTDIQMDYARVLGVVPRSEDFVIRVYPGPEDVRAIDALLSRIFATAANHAVTASAGTGRPQSDFIVLHAARGISTRASQWPTQRFAELGDVLAAAFCAPVILTGSAHEAALVGRIASAMHERAINVAGKTSLLGFADLARRARVVVALDSGPMHLAAAAGAPTVGIFALRTDHPQRWRPLGPRVAVVPPTYPCPPRCRKETCRSFACYAALEVDRIVAAARDLASEGPATPATPASPEVGASAATSLSGGAP